LGKEDYGSTDILALDSINQMSAQLGLPVKYADAQRHEPTVTGQKFGVHYIDKVILPADTPLETVVLQMQERYATEPWACKAWKPARADPPPLLAAADTQPTPSSLLLSWHASLRLQVMSSV
jgi:hypothetical protein